MWIILLDRSESMSWDFSGLTGLKGRVTTLPYRKKWDAAKRALLSHIESLGQPDLLSLVAFNDRAKEIYRGDSQNSAAISEVLERTEPSGGTDIPAALREGRRICEMATPGTVISLLLISDGLSRHGDIAPAADSLHRLQIVVDVVLIDPTEEGIAAAKTIAGRRPIVYVGSDSQLGSAVAAAADRHTILKRQTQAVVNGFESQAAAIVRDDVDDVSFSCGYPQEIEPAKKYPLWVFVHPVELRDQVARIVTERADVLGARTALSSTSSETRLAAGTVVRISPRLSNAVCDPVAIEIEWRGELQEVTFTVSASSASLGQRIDGSIDVLSAGVLIGVIPVSIVVTTGKLSRSSRRVETARMFRSIFASYAHKDRAVVDACVRAYRALGVHVLVDKDILMSGEEFAPALSILIQKADVFQLYWSARSKASAWVGKEWRQALALTGPGGRKEPRFIRPLYWEEPVPLPPDELAGLHFARLEVPAGGLTTSRPSASRLTHADPSRRDTAKGIVGCVISLDESSDPAEVEAIRRDVAESVRFIEETAGIRYYPVPTFAVDRYTVLAARRETGHDERQPQVDAEQLQELCTFVRTLTVRLHTGSLLPGGRASPHDLDKRLIPNGWSYDAYALVLRHCEGGVDHCIRERLNSAWEEVRRRVASVVPWLRTAPLQVFLPWALSALSEIHLALSQVNSSPIRNATGLVNNKDLEAISSMQLRAEQRMRIRPFSGDPNKSWVEADLEAVSDLYHVGASVLRQHERNKLKTHRLSDSQPPAFMALPIIRIAEGFGGSYKFNVVTRWPHHVTLSTGPTLDADMVKTLTIDLSPSSILAPGWVRMRDEWAGVGLASGSESCSDFCRIMLTRVSELLKTGLAALGDSPLHDPVIVPSTAGGQRTPGAEAFAASLGEAVSAFAKVRQGLEGLLASPRLDGGAREYAQMRSTYGVFLDGTTRPADVPINEAARSRGIPEIICMQGVAKVVICLRELAGVDPVDFESTYASVLDLRRCVTVHEHFHAALALDRTARSAVIPKSARATCSALEESLATWMELHNARSSPRLFEVVGDYVSSGEWPQWPYAGAEALEHLYQARGLRAIQALVKSFTDDPITAAVLFDSSRERAWLQEGAPAT